MSYNTLKAKVEQLIEKAQSSSGTTEIKVASFPAGVSSDIYDGDLGNDIIGFIYDSEGTTKNPLPESTIIFDVGIVLNDDTEIRKNQMKQPSVFRNSVIEIFSPLVYNEDYFYPVLRVIDISNQAFTQPLYDIIINDGYKQLNIYYI